jgi:hypothetical protein
MCGPRLTGFEIGAIQVVELYLGEPRVMTAVAGGEVLDAAVASFKAGGRCCGCGLCCKGSVACGGHGK